MGDRSGSREPKLSSLKKSKKNPGAPASRVKKVAKAVPTSLHSLQPPNIRGGLYFDCSAALLSRQFDRDRDRVLSRAQSDNVCAVIVWFSDIEKQQSLYELTQMQSGFCYMITGIHPDNIEKMNKKNHDVWFEKIEEIAKKPECVGIISGLNLTRDIGTHFPQETILRASCALADKLILPLVLHCAHPNSLKRAIEILEEEQVVLSPSSSTIIKQRRVVIYDPVTASGGDPLFLKTFFDRNIGFMISGVGLTDPDPLIRSKAQDCVKNIPLEYLLSCTDSPWRTPQNIPDEYLCTLRNEPCNIPFVNQAITETFGYQTRLEEFSNILRQNAMKIFGLELANKNEVINSTTSREPSESSNITSYIKLDASNEKLSVDNLSVKLQNTLEIDNLEKSANINDETIITSSIVEESNDALTKVMNPSLLSESYYGCKKCRTRLFDESLVKIHGFDNSKTVFKVGEEGLCHTTSFVSCTNMTDLANRTELLIKIGEGETILVNGSYPIECRICSCKLGKFYTSEAYCACGATVSGPVARLLTSKVVFVHHSC
jgi:TatD DNase family protein